MTYQPTADRPTPCEESKIEITPEMIEAGVGQLYQDDWAETKEEWAVRIFRAMLRARKQDQASRTRPGSLSRAAELV